MDGIVETKSSLNKWFVHITVALIVAVWVAPTLGLFVSSLRTNAQISVSGWWLSVFPLDSFVPNPVRRMEIDGSPDEINDVHKDLIEVVKKVSGLNWNVGSIERQQFYKESLDAFSTVVTGEARPYGCFIFTKGVIKPDGTVWVLGED